MRGFRRSSNPYLSGTRPRIFFSDRRAMIQREITLGNGGKKFNPNWDQETKEIA